MAGLELSKLLGCEAAASLKIRLVGCEVGAGVSLYCCKLLGWGDKGVASLNCMLLGCEVGVATMLLRGAGERKVEFLSGRGGGGGACWAVLRAGLAEDILKEREAGA